MPRKSPPVPVNIFGDESGTGISIERFAFENLPGQGIWDQPERHDRQSFFLIETGNVTIEIDFETYHIQAPALVYMHPDQVHRLLGYQHITACALAITEETLNPEYRYALQDISPAAPLPLDPQKFGLLQQAADLCIKIAEQENDQLHQPLLRQFGNAFIGLILATYTNQATPSVQLSRAEQVTKTFRQDLSTHFAQLKRPAAYAERQNITTAYLNECVKNTTGHPVTHHIQLRIILEVKRLLSYSGQSFKQIADTLGYDDYTYLSRLFSSHTGTSPKAFRQNHRE